MAWSYCWRHPLLSVVLVNLWSIPFSLEAAKCSLTTLIIGFAVGCYFGATRERQTLYQSTGFQVQNYINALTAIQNGELASATISLEIDTAAGVLLLSRQDALMTSLSKSYVEKALAKAKCYGDKYSWKNLKVETTELLKPVLQNVECRP